MTISMTKWTQWRHTYIFMKPCQFWCLFRKPLSINAETSTLIWNFCVNRFPESWIAFLFVEIKNKHKVEVLLEFLWFVLRCVWIVVEVLKTWRRALTIFWSVPCAVYRSANLSGCRVIIRFVSSASSTSPTRTRGYSVHCAGAFMTPATWHLTCGWNSFCPC